MRLFFTAEVVAIDMGAISKRGPGGARMQLLGLYKLWGVCTFSVSCAEFLQIEII